MLYHTYLQLPFFVVCGTVFRWKALYLHIGRLRKTVYGVLKSIQTSCCPHTQEAVRVRWLWQDVSSDVDACYASSHGSLCRRLGNSHALHLFSYHWWFQADCLCVFCTIWTVILLVSRRQIMCMSELLGGESSSLGMSGFCNSARTEFCAESATLCRIWGPAQNWGKFTKLHRKFENFADFC